MILRKILFITFLLSEFVFGQYNLNYYIHKALSNSPVLKEYKNLSSNAYLQYEINKAQNSAFQVSLTGNYLYAPYFDNGGRYVSTNPGPNAIGYDASITNGGLYAAEINFQKNIFNGGLINALKEQRSIEEKSYGNKSKEEEHNLVKVITDQYLNTLQFLKLYNLSEEIDTILNNQLNLTAGMVKKGYASAQDYLLLKIELKSQQIALQQTMQNYSSGLADLNSICGITDTSNVNLLPVEIMVKPTKENSNFLLQYSIDSLSAANRQKVFETKYLPQVDVFFNTGLNAVELNEIQRKFGLSAGIDFSLPILDGNQRDLTRQQTILAEKSLNDYKSYVGKNIRIQKSNALKRISSLKKNISDLKSQVKDYKELLKISESQLQNGNLSMIEYLTLLKNYIVIQKNKITTEINYQLEISNYNYWNW